MTGPGGERTPFIWCVDIRARPDSVDEFLAAITRQAERSRACEPGCLRFEVFRHQDDPLSFRLVEVYASEDDLRRVHRQTSYFAQWTEVADRVLDGDREAAGYQPVRLEIEAGS